ncbi:hypothetical protein ABFS83_12G156700 [Erythranthe nasuta]
MKSNKINKKLKSRSTAFDPLSYIRVFNPTVCNNKELHARTKRKRKKRNNQIQTTLSHNYKHELIRASNGGGGSGGEVKDWLENEVETEETSGGEREKHQSVQQSEAHLFH